MTSVLLVLLTAALVSDVARGPGHFCFGAVVAHGLYVGLVAPFAIPTLIACLATVGVLKSLGALVYWRIGGVELIRPYGATVTTTDTVSEVAVEEPADEG